MAGEEDGYVLSLDDAIVLGQGKLQMAEHVTRTFFACEPTEELQLSEKELADLGNYVLARLNAFRKLGEI